MKNIFKHIALFLVFIGTNLSAQTTATITKPEAPNTDYIVTGTATLVATQSIVLKPNTWIKSGSTFLATINSDAYIPLNFSNENYVYTRTFQTAMTTAEGISNNKDLNESITYFDGLGRPMQNIAIKASPFKQDIVTHIGYDGFGRQDKDYLPYLAETGALASYRTGADTSTNSYYVSNYSSDINSSAPNPYTQKQFEDSPLNRILLQAAPGSAWALNSGHEIKMDYQTNIANEVKLFIATTAWNPTTGIYDITLGNPAANIYYPANELFKTVTKDENWTSRNENTTEEFKDKEGRIILKKTYGTSVVNGSIESAVHETYYIYDIYGNLTYVLPPKADGVIDAAVLSNLSYQYKYDAKNRLVEKKLPGKEWEFVVYDKLDRPVLTQDANLRAQNKWIFTKYDAFSRPVYTGEYMNVLQSSRAAVQALAEGTVLFENRSASAVTIGDTAVNYTNTAFPSSGITPFTITYYDDYINIDLNAGTPAVSYGITPITNPKGLITVSKIRILGTSLWTTNVNYYDQKGRNIYSYSKNNYLAAINTAKKQLDFTGKVLETTSTHQKAAGSVITITDNFAYDHTGRILSQKQKINDQAKETIYANTYDNLGQLIAKGVGGTTASLQTVNYKYNIRGWLKNINDINAIGNDLFAFQINYNTTNNSNSTALFNGNISETFWKTANIDPSLKSYTYAYDELNRLIGAIGESNDQQELVSYDKNGNIMSLYRTGIRPKNTGTSKRVMQIFDNLTYTYDPGNKLVKVEDSQDASMGFKNGANLPIEYTYDDNGNMKTDANKGINTNIAYNYLNLPTLITLPEGTISYTYDATGVKQRKIAGSITTDYADGFQYQNNILQFMSQPEGYVSNNNGVFEYIYQYKDHLGNVRLSYNKDLSIIEENNYYPFGLKQIDNNNVVNSLGNAVANKYKYNGKELQDELGLNMYDYGGRNYMPDIGRTTTIDPHAYNYTWASPYNYAFNNPTLVIDPDGKDGIVTGSGTKDDPFRVKANYYYYGLSGKQTKGLNDAISSYNNNGEARSFKDADGNSTYVVMELTATEVADKDAAYDKAYSDVVEVGETTARFGNVITTGGASKDNHFGQASASSITLNQDKITSTLASLPGGNEDSLIKGTFIHEIGHNLGASHGDPGNIMDNMSMNEQGNSSQIGGGGTGIYNYSYPSINNSGVRAFMGRVNSPGSITSYYLTPKENKKVEAHPDSGAPGVIRKGN